ncbi:MAG: hypothetical protein R6V06_01065 [Kiritimatiellia bacterium]
MRNTKCKLSLLLTLTFFNFAVVSVVPVIQQAYVDKHGVLRWRGSDNEIALLGVNYYTPFTVDYNQIRL